jgi:hypothetical protein
MHSIRTLLAISALGQRLPLLIGLFLVSGPAAAEVYPVSGAWTAIDTEFPAAAIEARVAVKNVWR